MVAIKTDIIEGFVWRITLVNGNINCKSMKKNSFYDKSPKFRSFLFHSVDSRIAFLEFHK